MKWQSIIFLVVVGFVVIGITVVRWWRVASMLSRSCAGRAWRLTFPDAPKDDIREFLEMFLDAFGLNRKHKLKFRPTDRISDVYHVINPPFVPSGDSLELEEFAQVLETRYQLTLESVSLNDLTLGDLFARTRSA